MDTQTDYLALIEQAQRELCDKHLLNCVPCSPHSKLGFALSTEGRLPVNGLRHPAQGDTNGWYIWCGEEFTTEPGFFSPLHSWHLFEKHPEVMKLLGLPPGSRFLVAGDYLDIWSDPGLLDI